MRTRIVLFFTLMAAAVVVSATGASACGGFFCQNTPVDQVGERIVFTVNPDETITTLIEIQYTGSAEDFSWILPIPEAIGVDDLQVPEDGELVFDELHQLTDVQFIPPREPDCSIEVVQAVASDADDAMEEDGVDVFASGEVGPFGFDVIGSDDPEALIGWLRDNNYRVTDPMIPLIDVYVEAEMAFVAMRLLDGETAESIQPIELTYGGTEPMIPLQLTAVAAQPNMPIWVWIFAEHQAASTNFTNMEIATEEITFFPFGGNDYTFLVQQRANALDGHAFITEYAQPVTAELFAHPWLTSQVESSPYLTRLNTYIDPEEMTADPMFALDPSLPDVSNIRDASELNGLYMCERGAPTEADDAMEASDAIDPMDGTGQVVAFTPAPVEQGTPEDTDSTNPSSIDAETENDETTDSTELAADGEGVASNDDGRRNGIWIAIIALVGGLGAMAAVIVRRADD